MDGLEAVEIQFSDLSSASESLRIDSEFFKKDYLQTLKVLSQQVTLPLRTLCKQIIHPAEITREYADEGIQILLAQNVRDNTLDFSKEVYMDESVREVLAKNKLSYNDVVMTRSGANYGQVASFKSYKEIFACADVLVIKKPKEILGGYLSTFLNTVQGKHLIERGAYGMAQPHIAPTYLYDLPIPRLPALEDFIDQILEMDKRLLVQAQALYQEAENILLEHLGLKDWQPSKAGVSVKSFADAFGAERLDPEFYQPKFDDLENIISAKENVQPLGEFLVVNARGKQPNYEDDGVLVVNSKHVRTGKVIVNDNRRATLEKNALTIRKGDVLINGTGVGTIGRCAPYLHDEIALPDNHVTILRTNDLDPVYLSVYLNSPAGQLQVDKHFKGSSGQIELYPDQIANFYVWEAPEDVQRQIREKVEAFYKAEQLSEQLLDLAKRGVELAIEESETAALAWIEEQLSSLGLNNHASR